MKAVTYAKYGPPEVLQLEEIAKPVPSDDEMLIRIRATTVTAGDWRMRKPSPFAARLYNGLFRPKKVTILGLELAGEIESAGKSVTRFGKGDEVFAFTGFGFGGYAEYRCLPDRDLPRGGRVAVKPTNIGFEEAAAIPAGGLTALAYLRAADIEPGDNVLIYGASGSIGTVAVQIAKHFGAVVTGVCSSANLELVRSLGADNTIDYRSEDFADAAETYDVVFDAVSKARSSACLGVLKPNGRYLISNPSLWQRLRGIWTSWTSAKKTILGVTYPKSEDLALLGSLVEAEAIRPVIDRRFALAEIPEAHRYVEAGHKKGNVVVTVG